MPGNQIKTIKNNLFVEQLYLCKYMVYNENDISKNYIDPWIEESMHIRKRYYEGNFVVGKGPILEDE